MSLLTKYQELINQQILQSDFHQKQVVSLLDAFATDLISYSTTTRWFFNSASAPKSHYLYGKVGRGKTMLMDLLYDYLPIKKQRLHFNEFMQWLHKELKSYQGKKDPLTHIAGKLTKKIDLLCFDELQVIDIADAMLLGRFFTKLLDTGVVLCITSNFHPSRLYENGLQRQRFTPVIDKILDEFTLVPLEHGEDYRRRGIVEEKRLFFPLSHETTGQVLLATGQLQDIEPIMHSTLIVNNRKISAMAIFRQANAAVFSFDELCDKALGSSEYLQLSKSYKVIGIVNILKFDNDRLDQLRRFVYLIDTLYEAECACLFSAECNIDALYTGKKMQMEFQRCASRLYCLLQAPTNTPTTEP